MSLFDFPVTAPWVTQGSSHAPSSVTWLTKSPSASGNCLRPCHHSGLKPGRELRFFLSWLGNILQAWPRHLESWVCFLLCMHWCGLLQIINLKLNVKDLELEAPQTMFLGRGWDFRLSHEEVHGQTVVTLCRSASELEHGLSKQYSIRGRSFRIKGECYRSQGPLDECEGPREAAWVLTIAANWSKEGVIGDNSGRTAFRRRAGSYESESGGTSCWDEEELWPSSCKLSLL